MNSTSSSIDSRSFKTLRWHQDKSSAQLVLNRPEVRNALNPQMISELTQIFLQINQESQIKSIVLSGEGSAFCAGADLEWMKSMKGATSEENFADSKRLFELFSSMQNCLVPIIGQFHGALMGGALGLASLCDLGAAEAKTQFAFSEIKLGIAPAVISPFVCAKMSISQVRPWILTGERFDAVKAERMGLVQFVGTQEEVEKKAQSWVAQFDLLPIKAVREIKKMLLMSTPQVENPDRLCQMISDLRVAPEGQEGLSAFLEKRKPQWPVYGGG